MTVRRLGDRERGASAIELALYTPVMFLVIFMIIQFALVYHGNQVAHGAAREGARIARLGGGTPEALTEARAAAADHAARLGGNQLVVESVEATMNEAERTVRVRVCGTAKEIVQNTTPTVCQHAEGPIEEFRPDG